MRTDNVNSEGIIFLARQFSLFTLVGVVGTAAHYIVLVVLVELLALNAVASSAAGALCGALVNYLLNHRFTFRSAMPHGKTLPRFLTVATAGFAINALIMYLGVEVAQMYYLLVQILATGMVLVWNFVANKLWTFSGETA